MYRKIELFEIPPFFVKADLPTDTLKEYIFEFEGERGQFGYQKTSAHQKAKIRKKFCKRYGLKLAFDSIITYEIYKQGRTRKWLYDRAVMSGFKYTYMAFCNRLSGKSAMEDDVKRYVYHLLSIH